MVIASSADEHRKEVTRRQLLRAGAAGALGLLLAQWAGTFLSFFWPKNVGAFGGKITVGRVEDFPVGSVTRVREGRFFLVHLPEGFVALYWKCPHLGCTVPWEPAEDRFHCPCHGSIYLRNGERVAGPAPRPLDLMAIEVVNGKIVVDTGKITQRARWDPSQAVKV